MGGQVSFPQTGRSTLHLHHLTALDVRCVAYKYKGAAGGLSAPSVRVCQTHVYASCELQSERCGPLREGPRFKCRTSRPSPVP